MFLITQIHGVRFRRWHKLAIAVVSLTGATWFYTLNIDQLAVLPRIVLGRYVAVFIMVGVIWLVLRPFVRRGKAVPGIRAN